MRLNDDYKGKTVFIGIDVHKKTYSVAAVCDGVLVKRDTLTATPQALIKYFHKYFAGAFIKSAYEAGFCGFYLHRTLIENHFDNIVVHAAAIEISSRDRVKTDKRDATKIAVQLSNGRLKSIYIPSKIREDQRELTRLRDDLVKQRNRYAVKLKHKANYYGLIGPSDSKKVSIAWIGNLLKKKMPSELRFHVVALVEQWKIFHAKIMQVNKRMAKQAEEDYNCEKIYRSAIGVGPTAARVLANELGDMSQFSSERALFSYTGLTPSEHSSGEHRRQGHISRQGKPILRKVLVQCSWVAIRHDANLKEVYERIKQRAGSKRAIVAVARRFIGRIRACFRTGQQYRVKEEELIA